MWDLSLHLWPLHVWPLHLCRTCGLSRLPCQANTRDATTAIMNSGCKPKPSKHGLSIKLHLRPTHECAAEDSMCAAAAAVAKTSSDGRREVIVVSGGAQQAAEMKLLLDSARRAKVTNLLLILTDVGATAALGSDLPPSSGSGPRSLVRLDEAMHSPLGSQAAWLKPADWPHAPCARRSLLSPLSLLLALAVPRLPQYPPPPTLAAACGSTCCLRSAACVHSACCLHVPCLLPACSDWSTARYIYTTPHTLARAKVLASPNSK